MDAQLQLPGGEQDRKSGAPPGAAARAYRGLGAWKLGRACRGLRSISAQHRAVSGSSGEESAHDGHHPRPSGVPSGSAGLNLAAPGIPRRAFIPETPTYDCWTLRPLAACEKAPPVIPGRSQRSALGTSRSSPSEVPRGRGVRAHVPPGGKARACAAAAARQLVGPTPTSFGPPLAQPPPRRRRAPQPGHLGVLSLPKRLCYPLPQVSAQVPAPFGLVHWPFLTELKKTPVAAGRHFGPRLSPPLREESAGACALGPEGGAGRGVSMRTLGRPGSPAGALLACVCAQTSPGTGPATRASPTWRTPGTAWLLFFNDCTSSRLENPHGRTVLICISEHICM